jgi:hypothetical protein
MADTTPLTGGARDRSAGRSHGGKLVPILVVLLFLLAMGNLVQSITTRRRIDEALAKQGAEMALFAHRIDACEQRYAEISGQVTVISERIRLTKAEQAQAKSVADDVRKRQKAAVKQLSQAIRQRALNDPSLYPIF